MIPFSMYCRHTCTYHLRNTLQYSVSLYNIICTPLDYKFQYFHCIFIAYSVESNFQYRIYCKSRIFSDCRICRIFSNFCCKLHLSCWVSGEWALDIYRSRGKPRLNLHLFNFSEWLNHILGEGRPRVNPKKHLLRLTPITHYTIPNSTGSTTVQ